MIGLNPFWQAVLGRRAAGGVDPDLIDSLIYFNDANGALAPTAQIGPAVTVTAGTGAGRISNVRQRFPGYNSWNCLGSLDIGAGTGVPNYTTTNFVIQVSAYYTSAPGGAFMALLTKSLDTGFWQMRLFTDASGNYVVSVCNTTPGVEFTIIGSAGPTVGAWDDLAVTREGSTFLLWKNAVVIGSATYAGALFTAPGGNWNINGFAARESAGWLPPAGTYLSMLRMSHTYFEPTVLTAPFPAP